MAKLSIVAGTTSKQTLLFIQDSSSTTGAGRSGLAFNTTGLSATYCFAGSLPVTITFATLTATTAAFSSGGFIEENVSIMAGWYRFDIPNAALAGTNGQVGIHFFGAASMAPLPVEIELTGWNNQLAFANQTIAAVVGTVAASVTAMSANISGNQTVAQVVAAVAASVTAMSANISGNQTVAAVAASIAVSIGPVTVAALVANIMGNQTIAVVSGSIGAVGSVVPANVVQINSITVIGSGTSVDLWRA